MPPLPRRVVVTRSGEGPASGTIGGARVIHAVTAADNPGGAAVHFAELPVGEGPPFHRHAAFDEVFVILEGVVEFQADDTLITAAAGDVVFVPGEIPHAPRCTAGNGRGVARLLTVVTPGRFNGFFEAMGELVARGAGRDAVLNLAAEYGIEFVDRPPLRESEHP
ncbi:MAG: cupin domain-containing protein [Planctomycetota bacterium]